MSLNTLKIIAEGPPATGSVDARAERRFAVAAAAVAIAWGTAAALVYASRGLTLSHYDARAHLVVARRVIDSLTPGWEQIGAVWLPLPHLLNMVPVQIDALYRTGAFGVAISLASLGLAVYAITALVLHAGGSRLAAASGVALAVSNPNLLYLQSTPMTEPLLFGLMAYAAWAIYRWTDDPGGWRRRAGWALVGACLTRYEAWPFVAAALGLGAVARWRAGREIGVAARDTLRLALYPAAAVIAFLFHSRATVGAWFVTGGFYLPDPALQGNLVEVVRTIWWTARRLGSAPLLYAAMAAVAVIVTTALRRRREALLVPLALFAVGALPLYAFYEGHPLRTRYMVPLVFAAAVSVGLGLTLLEARVRRVLAAAVLLSVLNAARPFDPRAPMVVEAQWDVERTKARRAVTACLSEQRGPRDAVLMSMSALAHYMQDMSHAGFGIRDFVHEGNGEIWSHALANPRGHVRWMLIDVKSKHRDQLKARADADPAFLQGFTPVCEAAGIALYRRN